MLLAATEYLRPGSVEEAVAALAGEPGARVLAGGQSLINVLKHRAAAVALLVDVSRLEELRFIRVDGDGAVEIGAAVTYAELERSDALREHHPVVSEVAAGLADLQVRNRGTIGGNACYADPASNFPPLLVALDATFQIAGRNGARDVAAEEFFTGVWRTALAPGELVRAVRLPALAGSGVGYRSLLPARDSWALARAAARIAANGTVQDARIVLGCVAGTPVRARTMERALHGREPTAHNVAEAAERAAEGVRAPSDAHASGDYRTEMARVMARRAALDALGIGA